MSYTLKKISEATVADPTGSDRILTQNTGTNPVTTWSRVYTWVKGQLDSVYQALLVSGTNIKTINGESVLGSGNIDIAGADIAEGAKLSSTDAGTLGQMSLTDDYLYICVQSGEAGSAIWKKTLLFKTD